MVAVEGVSEEVAEEGDSAEVAYRPMAEAGEMTEAREEWQRSRITGEKIRNQLREEEEVIEELKEAEMAKNG